MKAPKDQWVIQIEVTNACVNQCSNCTRFCGHHKKPFFMDYEYFCKAVDSVIDHPGLIGVMGGEPTLHPRFVDMCKYLYEKLPDNKRVPLGKFNYPTDSFVEVRRQFELDEYEIYKYADGPRPIIQGAGLWTSMTKKYKEHFEIIQDVFNFQNLNDHSNESYHQPVLITRKDMGIDDKTWKKLREKCWVNQQWSGSITPKGCFFCEVAAALDMLYDGPGGLPLEKDWWKKDISEFKDQFKWCELCGVPLKTFARDAREGIDDISETHYQMMHESSSAKLNDEMVNQVKIENGVISAESMKSAEKYHGVSYIDDAQERVSKDTPIYVESFVGVVVGSSNEEIEKYKRMIERNTKYFDHIYIFANGNILNQDLQHVEKLSDLFSLNNKKTYFIFITPNIELDVGIEYLKSCVINPGSLIYGDFNINSMIEWGEHPYIKNHRQLTKGYFILTSNFASCFDNDKLNYKLDMEIFSKLYEGWDVNKRLLLSESINDKMYGVNDVFNGGANRKRRFKDGMHFVNKCFRRYGFFTTIGYGISMTKRYGIKLMINKFRSRIF